MGDTTHGDTGARTAECAAVCAWLQLRTRRCDVCICTEGKRDHTGHTRCQRIHTTDQQYQEKTQLHTSFLHATSPAPGGIGRTIVDPGWKQCATQGNGQNRQPGKEPDSLIITSDTKLRWGNTTRDHGEPVLMIPMLPVSSKIMAAPRFMKKGQRFTLFLRMMLPLRRLVLYRDGRKS